MPLSHWESCREDILIWLCPALPIVHPGCGVKAMKAMPIAAIAVQRTSIKGHRMVIDISTAGRYQAKQTIRISSAAVTSQCQASSCQRPQQWPTYVTVPVSIHVAIAMAQPAPHNRGQEWMMTVDLEPIFPSWIPLTTLTNVTTRTSCWETLHRIDLHGQT